MVLKNTCDLVLWIKVASALEGLISSHLQKYLGTAGVNASAADVTFVQYTKKQKIMKII